MEYAIIGLLLINLGGLVILLFRKAPAPQVDTSKMEERLIRVEGGLDKITPKIEAEFRDNRKEINESLQGSRKEISGQMKGRKK